MLKLTLNDIYVTTTPLAPIPPESIDQLETNLKCRLPAGFRTFLTQFGPCTLGDIEIYGPDQIQQQTTKQGTQLKAYGLKTIPASLRDAQLNKAILIAAPFYFFHPSVPDRIFQNVENAIIERGASFDDLVGHIREISGNNLKKLYLKPSGTGRITVQNLMSARRKHCFDAVHLMLAPQDASAGETLEFDEENHKFLIGLRELNGTVFCSCQTDDHRVRLEYDSTGDPAALSKILALLQKLGYERPSVAVAPTLASEANAVVTEDVTYANERIIAEILGYGLDKGPIAGDLVFTNCRLLFFHSYEKDVSIGGMSIQDLLSAGLRYDVYNYDNIRKIVLKRNLFGRSVVVVTPKNAGKNKFWGPKKNLDDVIAASHELRELKLPLHIAL